jgi:hypothetical protein
VPALSSQILYIGNDVGTHPMNGWISEAVIWTADMSASLGTLETTARVGLHQGNFVRVRVSRQLD